jgi:thioredoxin-related protein
MRWVLLWMAVWALPGAAQAPPEWFVESFLDIREDAAEAAREGKRLMIYFMQDGCPYCRELVTVNFRDPRIVEKMQRRFMSVALNIWGDREVTAPDGRKLPEKRFAAALKVQFTPTLVFFDEKGAVVHRINGYLPPEEFYVALERALAPRVGLSAPQGVRPSPALPGSSSSVSGLAASRSSSACSRSTWRCSSVDISAAKARTASARAFAATSL